MIVFLSNYFNHHQSPLSDALYLETNNEYRFIATMPMEEERLKMGWGGDVASYVMQYSDSPDECDELISEADVVIFGSAPYKLVKNRLKANKLTFLYSERVYKKKCPFWQIPLRALKYFAKYGRYKSLYLLCASAYTAPDYAITRTFIDKAYKWGYFPAVKEYDAIDQLIELKHPSSILWVARLIEWKHPETAIQVANKLKSEGYQFELNLIGNGDLERTLKTKIHDENLDDCVHMLGAMKPQEVREHMEKSQIFLFTSDRNEGWGAVLNEAMNSGCAVVASDAIGSVPFLLTHEKNGLIYCDGDQKSLYEAVKRLLRHPTLSEHYGVNAYETMRNMWNAQVAARRFLALVDEIQKHGHCDLFQEGPCSRA